MKKQTKDDLTVAQLIFTLAEATVLLKEVRDYLDAQVKRKELISTKEIEQTHFVSRQTVYRFVNKKLLVPVHKNRTYYFDRVDVSTSFNQYRN